MTPCSRPALLMACAVASPPWRTRLGRAGRHGLREALGGWLKAQGLLMLITFGELAAGFLLLRVELSLLLAGLVALVDALPVFGTGTVLLPWAVLALLGGDVRMSVGLLVLYSVISLVRSLLEPRLVGARVGLPSLAALVCMYVGFQALGVLGMLLAPLAVLARQLWDSGLLHSLFDLQQNTAAHMPRAVCFFISYHPPGDRARPGRLHRRGYGRDGVGLCWSRVDWAGCSPRETGSQTAVPRWARPGSRVKILVPGVVGLAPGGGITDHKAVGSYLRLLGLGRGGVDVTGPLGLQEAVDVTAVLGGGTAHALPAVIQDADGLDRALRDSCALVGLPGTKLSRQMIQASIAVPSPPSTGLA